VANATSPSLVELTCLQQNSVQLQSEQLKAKSSSKQPNQLKKNAHSFSLPILFLSVLFSEYILVCYPFFGLGIHLKAQAAVRLPFETKKQLLALLTALKPEVERQVGTRSTVALTADGLILVLFIKAEDTVALRAALNAYLRWINSASTVLNALELET
jgi:tRNA threonylcarbamoyladenosine modification (KEOPS) complex  Pcc1 subunit